MCLFSHSYLTAVCKCPAFGMPSHGNDFQTCGVHGPGANLPRCPHEHFKPTNQSHCTRAKGQVPVLLALRVGSEGELPTQSLK